MKFERDTSLKPCPSIARIARNVNKSVNEIMVFHGFPRPTFVNPMPYAMND